MKGKCGQHNLCLWLWNFNEIKNLKVHLTNFSSHPNSIRMSQPNDSKQYKNGYKSVSFMDTELPFDVVVDESDSQHIFWGWYSLTKKSTALEIHKRFQLVLTWIVLRSSSVNCLWMLSIIWGFILYNGWNLLENPLKLRGKKASDMWFVLLDSSFVLQYKAENYLNNQWLKKNQTSINN